MATERGFFAEPVRRAMSGLRRRERLWQALAPLRFLWRRVVRPIRRGCLKAGAALFHSEACVRALSPNPWDRVFIRYSTVRREFNDRLLKVNARFRLQRCRGRPSHAIIELSSLCNLRCPLCITGGLRHCAPHVQRGLMSFETCRKAVDTLLPELSYVQFYSWGEPFLNKALPDCVRYATDRRIVTELSTNMQLFTPELGEQLVDAGLSRIIVSCDGLTQDSYGKYRVGGSLDTVSAAVARLIDIKKRRRSLYPVIVMQFIVFRHNEHEKDAFERHWLDAGVDSVSFIPMSFMSHEGRRVAEEKAFVPADPAWAPYHPYGKVRNCFELYRHVTINWNGDIYTCCFPSGDSSYALGNILTDDFNAIWNGPKYRYNRRLVAHRKVEAEWFDTLCHDCTGCFPSDTAKRYW